MKKILAVLVLVLLGTVSYAQWATSGNDIYNTNTGNVGISSGAAFSPAEKFTIMNPAASANFRLERPYGTGANAAIGSFRILNSVEGSYFNFSFRYQTGNHEVIQSAYYAPGAVFKAFSYFNFTTGKYEVRNGVANAEFLNTGDVLFNNTGGVGVGVTALGSGVKFQVNGKVKCKEVEVAVTPWPDHVFNGSYNLMSLNEVEAYINANKHLPGVPSELEVSENGVNVGQMSATLLQKIEELTLYMINLQKENDALKVRVSNLEK